MCTGIVIQARSGSSRLPNKMLLPFYSGKTILDILLQRILADFIDLPVVLATSENEKDVAIKEIAMRNGVDCFRGSETDVLERFIGAAKEHSFSAVIRICADNPFLSMQYLRQLVDFSRTSSGDYISFCTSDGIPSIKTHFGFWTEYITLTALERIKRMTEAPLYHEHVTNYAYEHPDAFNCEFLPIDKFITDSGIRLTVDTSEDFKNASVLYGRMADRNIAIEPENILPLISPSMKTSMTQQIKANEK